jgi:hypothetical protein
MAQKTNYQRTIDLAEEQACWQGGTGSEWECDCIVSADFLSKLCLLASYAPRREIERITKEFE